ncbi:unnamed protein product [Ceutorhynchus assimilis]|uniref:Ig-like domain-containing protein n=1 Tax=Ceutorhynchus assimilis TaxID=467358 RepID=A0A9N9QPH6_9CUCU|nr:unnamed protein product [Ceutorhynchus assimilis]
MNFKLSIITITLCLIISQTSSNDDWASHCNQCSCIHVSGVKSANCSNRGFTQIPENLDTDIKDINFFNNPLRSLGDGVFKGANMANVHKLKFQNCLIEVVSESAFQELGVVAEIDLSRNSIAELKRDTFRDTVQLRFLYLSHNRLKSIEDGLLSNMTRIQKIYLDHNEIEYINENTFQNLIVLSDVNLGYNKLKRIEFDLKQKLPKLNSLNVEENPWVCDCLLETFHQSVLRNNLITQYTKCEEPAQLKNLKNVWTDRSVIFACAPTIINPSTPIILTDDKNVTLTCKVFAEPDPEVIWLNKGFNLEKRMKNTKYFVVKGKIGNYTWNNVTITSLRYSDQGEYKCIATNVGGQDEKNISLIIEGNRYTGDLNTKIGGSLILIIGLSITLIIILLIILILLCIYCKKTGKFFGSKHGDFRSSSEECINMSTNIELKKGLMTDVNPVSKPPRVTVPSSIVSGGTEVSDAKKNLLDYESMIDCDDDSRSFDFDQPYLRKSHNALLEPEYRHYTTPPDLLAFPARSQISPTGSNASTIVIDSRLPPSRGPQSPIHSPIYDQLSIYKTLPYSRSHSPFAQGATLTRMPRLGSGYVTIPRRPRQSWSSEPPLPNELIAEPVYDNLGVRSTADGSSVLSLNKTPEVTLTPRTNRIFPLTPTTIIDPIVESQESPGSSGQPQSYLNETTPTSKTDFPQIQPINKPIASQTLPRFVKLATPQLQDEVPSVEKRNSIGSYEPTKEEKVKKIPPRPPPKPKKLQATRPLFEDEGEDGTEV